MASCFRCRQLPAATCCWELAGSQLGKGCSCRTFAVNTDAVTLLEPISALCTYQPVKLSKLCLYRHYGGINYPRGGVGRIAKLMAGNGRLALMDKAPAFGPSVFTA